MNYLSIRQTAEKWNLSKRRVQILCAEDRITGAIRIDSTWQSRQMPKSLRMRGSSPASTERKSKGFSQYYMEGAVVWPN